MTKPITLLLALPVAWLSWRGGVWLWRALDEGMHGRERWVRAGAAFLALAAGVAALWLACLAGGAVSVAELSRAATLIVALSLAYNCGYLFSIAPARAKAAAAKRLLTPTLALAPAGPVLVALAGPPALPESGVPQLAWGAAGLALTLTGFAVWEVLRRQPALEQDALRTILWRLSVGFVGVSALIVAAGLGAARVPALHEVVVAASWLLLVSLFFYLLGLFAALRRR